MARRMWQSGRLVSAADMNEQSDLTVWRFPSESDRLSQLLDVEVPTGTISVITSTLALDIYTGSGWERLYRPAEETLPAARLFGEIPNNRPFTTQHQQGCWSLAELAAAQDAGIIGWQTPALTGGNGTDYTVDGHIHRVYSTAGASTMTVAYSVAAQILCIGGGGGGGGCGDSDAIVASRSVEHAVGSGGGGGGAGVTVSGVWNFYQGETYAVSVGAGGAAGAIYTALNQRVRRGRTGGPTRLTHASRTDPNGHGGVAFAGGGGGGGGSYDDNSGTFDLSVNGTTARSGGGAGVRISRWLGVVGSPGGTFGTPRSGTRGGEAAYVVDNGMLSGLSGRVAMVVGGGGGGFGSAGVHAEGGQHSAATPTDAINMSDVNGEIYSPGGEGISLNLTGSTIEYCAGGPGRAKLHDGVEGPPAGFTTVDPTGATSAGSGGAARVNTSHDGQPGLIVIRYPESGQASDLTLLTLPTPG